MPQAEQLFNIGYVAAGLEASPGGAVTPGDFFQAYDADITTNRNFQKLAPAAGNVYGTQKVVEGLRDHMGTPTLIFEPNTFEKLVAMMLKAGDKSGSDPYTADYTLDPAPPKTYTFDVSSGDIVQRYFGGQVEKLSPNVNSNEIQIKPAISFLGSFQGREVASIAGTSPYVFTLKTDYDPAPATGIVVGDIMRMYKADGTTVDFTVSAVTATTISTTTNVSTGAAGSMVYLRPQAVSFDMLPPVLWSNTQFCFGDDAADALSATQFRVDPGSIWELDYAFSDNKGEHRSGSQDPATLLRKPAEISLTVKKYFRSPADVEAYNNMSKSACVIRHFVYSDGNTYEIRVTLNNLTTTDPTPKYKAGAVNYSEIKYIAAEDASDGQAFDVKVINARETLS